MFEDDLDFHYSTDAEWDRAEARELGAMYPERAWICTDRDVIHANPFYTGPKVPHPDEEDYMYPTTVGAMPFYGPILDRDFDDVVPF